MMQATRRVTLRRLVDRLGTGLSVAALIAALVPLGAMVIYIVVQGAAALNIGFFTKMPGQYGQAGGGMAPMMIGTLIIIGLTSIIGIPFGLLSGVYLARHGDGRFGYTVRFVTDVVAGTPSILAGVIASAVLVVTFHGYSAYSAAVALALLMFPTVTRATEEAVRAVPTELREAALALGAPEWKLMLRIIIPTAASGIVTAIVLGIARVAGETAPLYFTAFGNPFFSTNIFAPIGALPLQIWQDAQSPYPTDHTAAFAGAFVLFAIIVILNLVARGLTYRLAQRTRTA